MLRRFFLIFTLALLFGLGQQGAMMHAVSHLSDWQDSQSGKSGHTQACDKCMGYAELSNALGSQTFALPALPQVRATFVATASPTVSVFHFPYSARAPPVFA